MMLALEKGLRCPLAEDQGQMLALTLAPAALVRALAVVRLVRSAEVPQSQVLGPGRNRNHIAFLFPPAPLAIECYTIPPTVHPSFPPARAPILVRSVELVHLQQDPLQRWVDGLGYC